MNNSKQVTADRARSNVIKMYGLALENFYKSGYAPSLTHMHQMYRALYRHIETRPLAKRLAVITWTWFNIPIGEYGYTVVPCKYGQNAIRKQLEYMEAFKAGITELK